MKNQYTVPSAFSETRVQYSTVLATVGELRVALRFDEGESPCFPLSLNVSWTLVCAVQIESRTGGKLLNIPC